MPPVCLLLVASPNALIFAPLAPLCVRVLRVCLRVCCVFVACVRRAQGMADEAHGLAMHPHRTELAIASYSGAIYLWDYESKVNE